jgi:hypothetical protein
MANKIGAGGSIGAAAAAAAAAKAAAEAAARAAAKAAAEAAARAAAKAAAAAAAKTAAAAAAKSKDAFGGVKGGVKGGLAASVKGDGFVSKLSAGAGASVKGDGFVAKEPTSNGLRLSAGLGAAVKGDDFEVTKPKSSFDLGRMTQGAFTLSDDLRTSQTPADEVKEAQLTNQISNDASTKLSAAKTEYDDAKEVVDRSNGRLAQELKRIGPGLTKKQKEEYIKAYEKAHAPELAKAKEAAQKLAATLNETKGMLSDPAGSKLALDSAKALAKTPEGAETAKNFVKEVSTNPDSPIYKALVESQGVEETNKQLQETLGAAIPNLLSEALKSTDGDPQAAAAKLKQSLDGLDSAKGIIGNLEGYNKGIEALAKGDFAALKAMDSDNPISNALKVAGVMIGIAKVANGTAEAQDVLGTGKDGMEVTALAMEALAKTLPQDGSLAAAAGAGSKWLSKLAPGIGMVASALSTAADFKALCKDPNAGDALKMIGNAMSTVGGALALTGIGEVVAVPLQVVGGLITATGGIVSQLREESIISEESKQLLRDSGVDEAFITQLTSASPKALRTLEESGMSPEQVQELMSKHPEVFSNPGHQERFAEAAKACGLQGDDVIKFAEALKKDNPDYPVGQVPYNLPPGVIRNIVRTNFPSTRPLISATPQ